MDNFNKVIQTMLDNQREEIMVDLVYLVVASVILVIVRRIIQEIIIRLTNKKIRDSVYNGSFIYFEDFERNWIVHKRGRKGVSGYKYQDEPGCYVILIFPHKVTDGNFKNYRDVYIGQSINICKRVHSHFTGKGNGNVYADIRYGKEVYVQLVPCHKQNMNSKEKRLINAFNATQSYNMTRGGSRRY